MLDKIVACTELWSNNLMNYNISIMILMRHLLKFYLDRSNKINTGLFLLCVLSCSIKTRDCKLHESLYNFSLCHCAGVGSSSLSGGWSRLQGVLGQDTIRVKAAAGVVFKGCQDRIRSGSRLELESSSRGVRTEYGQGQGWSWSRLQGVSGQDTVRVKAGAGVVWRGRVRMKVMWCLHGVLYLLSIWRSQDLFYDSSRG